MSGPSGSPRSNKQLARPLVHCIAIRWLHVKCEMRRNGEQKSCRYMRMALVLGRTIDWYTMQRPGRRKKNVYSHQLDELNTLTIRLPLSRCFYLLLISCVRAHVAFGHTGRVCQCQTRQNAVETVRNVNSTPVSLHVWCDAGCCINGRCVIQMKEVRTKHTHQSCAMCNVHVNGPPDWC